MEYKTIQRFKDFKIIKLILNLLICNLLILSCAYYNTFYNAERYYKEGLAKKDFSPSQAKTNFDKAIEKSALVISNYPKSKYVPDALFVIGMSHYYTGEYTKAIAKFENLLLVFPLFPRSNEANLYLAACLIQTGEYNQAIERLQVLNSRNLSRSIQEQAMFQMAELYFFKKDYDEATPVLKNFIVKYPKSDRYLRALLMLGDAERLAKNFPSAISTYEQCLQKTRQRIGDANTDTAQVYKQVNLYLAECFIESNREDEGLKIIDAIIAADTLPNTKSKLSGKVFLDLGNLFLRMNEPERARFYLRKVKSTAEQAEAYYRLANSYEVEAKFDTAKAYYDSVVQKQKSGELSTLAQSRLELLKLVVGDAPLLVPKDTVKTKIEEIKKPEEVEKLEEIEKQEEQNKIDEIQMTDTTEFTNFMLPDTLITDTIPIKKDSLKITEKSDTMQVMIKNTTPKVDSAAVQFHLAEIYNLNLKQYERAISEYEKVYIRYAQSSFAPKALFAQAWLYKNMLNAASDTSEYNTKYKQVLNKLIADYAGTEYAKPAQEMLSQLRKQE